MRSEVCWSGILEEVEYKGVYFDVEVFARGELFTDPGSTYSCEPGDPPENDLTINSINIEGISVYDDDWLPLLSEKAVKEIKNIVEHRLENEVWEEC